MKKVIFIVFLVLIFFIGINEIENKNNRLVKNKEEVKINNNLAIMLETELGSGIYKESSANTWPNGYIFNNVLSYCENNTTLAWDSNTKSVILKNVNKSDKCYVYFDKVTFADYIISLYTKDGENNLYYHDGLGDYENANLEAGDYSYRYAGGDYHVTKLSLDKGYTSIYDVIPLKLDNGDIHKNNYWWGVDRSFYLAYQDDQKSTSLGTLLTRAISDGYIEKEEVHNYVCFGSSDSICPKENLYRIIGVFNNQVKLIKAGDANKKQLGEIGSFYASVSHDITYIGDNTYNKDAYFWDKTSASKDASWVNSTLNIINLNTNFIDYLTKLEDGKWIKKIADTVWQVGGIAWRNGHTLGAKTAYDYELGNNKNLLLTDPNKIGLMYVTDYYYATPNEYWTLKGYDSSLQDASIKNMIDFRGAIWDNWLWDGDTEWLITPRIEYTTAGAFGVDRIGHIATFDITLRQYAVRPCFYLNSNVEYVSGDGSINNPYRII